MSSISGSDTESEENESDDDDDDDNGNNVTTLVDDELKRLEKKDDFRLRKSNKNDNGPLILFNCPTLLPKTIHFGIYKNILQNHGKNLESIKEDLLKLQVTKQNSQQKHNDSRYWTMIMVMGGHFAVSI